MVQRYRHPPARGAPAWPLRLIQLSGEAVCLAVEGVLHQRLAGIRRLHVGLGRLEGEGRGGPRTPQRAVVRQHGGVLGVPRNLAGARPLGVLHLVDKVVQVRHRSAHLRAAVRGGEVLRGVVPRGRDHLQRLLRLLLLPLELLPVLERADGVRELIAALEIARQEALLLLGLGVLVPQLVNKLLILRQPWVLLLKIDIRGAAFLWRLVGKLLAGVAGASEALLVLVWLGFFLGAECDVTTGPENALTVGEQARMCSLVVVHGGH
mmetsp:Transcript_30259/g.75675  ORF Transcript_30259/g.75675 Transcript_30259/m.75675 type:complete len:264 (+) Transcript_30259:74-865(+)